MQHFRFFAFVLAVTAIPSLVRAEPASQVLDDFSHLEGWATFASQGAEIRLSLDANGHRGSGLRLDYDFHGGRGWVTAKKPFGLKLPDDYVVSYYARAEAPINDLEFKLLDAAGTDVWWWRRYDWQFSTEWQSYRLKKRMFQFAWGPSGGKPLSQLGALELTITSSSGGKGTIWLDDLRLESHPPDSGGPFTAKASAASTQDGSRADYAVDGHAETLWHSDVEANSEQWFELDLSTTRESGALVVDWDRDDYGTDYEIVASDDAKHWRPIHAVTDGNGGRDVLYLPDTDARYLRLQLQHSSRGQGYGIRSVEVKPYEYSAAPNRFFENLANEAPKGFYPRCLVNEQSNFAVVGNDAGDFREALLNADGGLEVDKGSFTVEPFLYLDGRLLTWNDVAVEPALEHGPLPIPSVQWRHEKVGLTVTAFGAEGGIYGRYRVHNPDRVRRRITLFLAFRPFQVTPPWQSLNLEGGVSAIRAFGWDGRRLTVNRSRQILPLTLPSGFGATTFDQGSVVDYLAQGKLPESTSLVDSVGFASGALRYNLNLAPGGSQDIFLASPYGDEAANSLAVKSGPNGNRWGEAQQQAAIAHWRSRLGQVEFGLPPQARKVIDSLRSNLGYILVNRDGASLQPGSRAYDRTWIRDGALLSSALLGMGFTDEVRQFLQWYAGFQFADGKIPCCVDRRGVDTFPEHDSPGEFIFAIAEYYRYTGDRALVRELWPHIVKTIDYVQALRAQRMTDAYRNDEKRAYFGLMPESASHEGYAAHPVHAYWDDFWVIRGLKDAVYLAEAVMQGDHLDDYVTLRDDFTRDVYASLRWVMAEHQLSFLPASVELADFDPNAVAMFVGAIGEQERLPQAALQKTFDDWYGYFRQRRDGQTAWENYTPYEVRMIEAYTRLGQRERALDILEYELTGQSPAAWNQWAEIVWRDPKTPKFIGDMPHTWIGAEYIRSVRSLFAYERESDDALVLAAGLPNEWIESPKGVSVKNLPTWYGKLGYTLKSSGRNRWRMVLSGNMTMPPGKLRIKLPTERALRSVKVNGRFVHAMDGSEVIVSEFPATLELSFAGGGLATK